MSHPSTDLAERYGTADGRRRRLVIALSGVLGVVALAWVGWATWFQSTPDVQSVLRSFAVVDDHTVTAELSVKPASAAVDADCLVRAYSEDHSVVGEKHVPVAGVAQAVTVDVEFRTERPATSVELVGCTTADQARPR